ncbi:hypothetical protein EGJ22_08230 [Pseudomonas sp. p99-361]|uniref:Uncharacterized protein n=1 Tax=Pseudomonas juntendi TaxID=2666183 RepID=A0AAJ5S787_9PSED|nr:MULTISPECIES: hypothetical protein [Pseudomonas]PYC08025.1 hypothetical protein DMX12_04575 [Pseudomonas sp. MB-090624]QEQ90606.1 hypothetical protein F1602_21785 [Pseudomonas putida]RRV20529.1 hypothetical protein EGJ22_08230 [Pseudomonas sp. p99-361]WEA23144.1 hypothetical protein PWA60_22250 [Pseudomonas juntendi]
MKNRGARFWEWADHQLHHRSHDEKLSDGTTIDVQSRLSRTGVAQLFIGVYRVDGLLLLEEYYPSRPGETISKALTWGTDRARLFATGGNLAVADDGAA